MSEEPTEYRSESIRDDARRDASDGCEEVVDKTKKYPRSDELRDRCHHKKLFGRIISLEYTHRYIEEKSDQIRHTEEYSYQSYTLQLKCKKENHRKVEDHPYKTLKRIGQVKVLEPSSRECCICCDDDRIRSSLVC
jgi:hypothetical protein